MAYCSVSQWTTTDWTEEMEALARDKFVPMILAVGADRVRMVRTGDNSFCVVTEYPDSATAQAAQDRIAEIRAQATDELPMTMSDVQAGDVFAMS